MIKLKSFILFCWLLLFMISITCLICKKVKGNENIYKPEPKINNNLRERINVSEALNVDIQHEENLKDHWQYVYEDPKSKFLVFSAYYDDRQKERFVRVIAAGKTRNPQKVLCRLYYSDVNQTTVSKLVDGTHVLIQENWNLPYSARYVLCPVLEEQKPDAVSVLPNAGNSLNILKVTTNIVRNKSWNVFELPIVVEDIAVCVKPFYNEYNMEIELVEFIELHRILGVKHFYFYNHTVGPQVNCLLQDYNRNGIATIINWELPLVSQKDIRTEGIFAALNDCLYRTMGLHSHVLFVDVDEYIIPHRTGDYEELIERINKHPSIQNTGAFSVQNSFFYRQWPDDEELSSGHESELASKLITLRKTRRQTKLNKHGIRSKYIVRPEMVTTVGNHFIWNFVDKKISTMKLDPQDALMHHYRVCEFGGNDCVYQSSIVDRTVYKYKSNLLQSVTKIYQKLGKTCNLN